jgi:hypothetical protein
MRDTAAGLPGKRSTFQSGCALRGLRRLEGAVIPRKTFLSVLLAVVLLPLWAWSAEVRLAWNPNSEANLAGYKVHYGNASGSYTTTVDVGNVTSATIPNLSEGITYYFSASAYNTTAVSSGYSNEVSYSVPVPNRPPATPSVPSGPSNGTVNTACSFSTSASDPDGNALQYRFDWGDGSVSGWGHNSRAHSWTSAGSYCIRAKASDGTVESGWSGCRTLAVAAAAAPLDTDGDGLSDELETNTYGTNPQVADSDGDGVPDGQEVAFWGPNWNGDIDSDGIVNLLDWDADGDGFSDGEELSKGSLPGDMRNRPVSLPMEAGEVAADHEWKRVSFARSFLKPVVVVGGLSANGSQAAVVRLRNMTGSGFEIRIQEWECYNGEHLTETVGYLAIESGVHSLPGSIQVEAGHLNAAQGGAFSAFTFKQTFPVAPVVIASVATVNDPNAVTARLDRITSKGFRLRLQEQEANSQDHGAETVAYVAWQPSSGDFDGVTFEVDRTGREITHTFAVIQFSEPHAALPVFLGKMQSAYGKDTADLQWQAKDEEGVAVRIAEEVSRDAETKHTAEVVGYMVFSATP